MGWGINFIYFRWNCLRGLEHTSILLVCFSVVVVIFGCFFFLGCFDITTLRNYRDKFYKPGLGNYHCTVTNLYFIISCDTVAACNLKVWLERWYEHFERRQPDWSQNPQQFPSEVKTFTPTPHPPYWGTF